jgi:hypothetical protein
MPDETDIYPALDHVAIVKSDATIYDNPRLRGLYVGTTGDVVVKCHPTGATVTYKNAPAGLILPINVYQVRAATTAADIVGFI